MGWGYFGLFLPIFVGFFMLVFLLTFSHGILQKCFWYYSAGHYTQKIQSMVFSTGVILGYFWAHFDVCSNISWEMFDFFSWNFIQIFLVYILWQSTHYFFFSCLVLMEPILVYVPLFRENHSIFSHEILYRCF